MNDEESLFNSGSDSRIEDGQTYDHAEHGAVEVTGIWHRTQRLDTVRKTDEDEMIVVRFVPAEDGTWTDECAESLTEFLDAID